MILLYIVLGLAATFVFWYICIVVLATITAVIDTAYTGLWRLFDRD